jgi:hypothetical protein
MMNFRKVFSRDFLQYHFSRIFAIAEKNVKIQLRFKFNLIYSIFSPFLPIFMSLIVLMRFFVSDVYLGRWNDSNYLVFLLTAFEIELLRRIIQDFPDDFRLEKYWKTLPALMIAPFNKVHLLFGVILSHLIIISIPFTVLFIITWFISPISFATIILIIVIYLLIDLIFSGAGLFLGVFAISKENYWRIFAIGIQILFYASCVIYPFEVFPQEIQRIIWWNPFYHVFEILRISWIEDNVAFTLMTFPRQFIILISTAIIVPLVGIYVFNIVYKRFGIVGY